MVVEMMNGYYNDFGFVADIRDIRQFMDDYFYNCGVDIADYDFDPLCDELKHYMFVNNITDLDDMPSDDFNEIVMRFDVSERGE